MFVYPTRWPCRRHCGLQVSVREHSSPRAFYADCKCAKDEHKLLVELACATTLAPAYSPALLDKLVPPQPSIRRTVVFIVCGGFKVSLDELAEYRTILDAQESSRREWEVLCNGEQWRIEKR